MDTQEELEVILNRRWRKENDENMLIDLNNSTKKMNEWSRRFHTKHHVIIKVS